MSDESPAVESEVGAAQDPWSIRRATVGDLDQIAALEAVIFLNDAWSRETWKAELESRHTWYLVVVAQREPSRVVGYAGLFSLPGSKDADVQTIAVAPEARGGGVGRRLIELLHDEARRRGVREVFLDVRVDNERAQNLYRSFGYEEVGIRKGYYQPDNVDAIVMKVRP